MLDDKNRKMLKNLYDIQKIAFDLERNPSNMEMIKNFENTAIKLDNCDTREYNNTIKNLLNVNKDIDEEKIRLEKLISLINKRVEKRNELLKDFNATTGLMFDTSEVIKQVDDLYSYKERLSNIRKYLDSKHKTKDLEKDLVVLKKELEVLEKEEISFDKDNKILEEELETKFYEIYCEYLNINNIEKYNLELRIDEIKEELQENLDSLKAFELAYETIKSAGMDINTVTRYDRDAYDFKVGYYNTKLKEIVARIYNIVLNKKSTQYEKIISKRDEIKNIINELYIVKSKYKIYEENFFKDFIYFINKQCDNLEGQAAKISDLNKIRDKIDFKEEKLNDFKNYLNERGVIKIMEEYDLIDEKRDVSDIKLELSDIKKNDNIDKDYKKYNISNNIKKEYKSNEIVLCADANDKLKSIEVKVKTSAVLKRVAEVLGASRKVDAPIFKPTIVKEPIFLKENKPEENKDISLSNTTINKDIFAKEQDDIFLTKIDNSKNDDIFFEMPSLPTQVESVSKVDMDYFPF